MKLKEEAGVANISLTSGDGALEVSFSNPFEQIPAVVVGFQESIGSGKVGFVAATSVGKDKFTITVDTDSILADVDVAWKASEKTSNRYT